jgi:5-methylcytosine-specific restriction endonuclease McrA
VKRLTEVRPLCGKTQGKTHCPKGHPYSGDNLLVNKYGHKVCRTCLRESEALRREQVRSNRSEFLIKCEVCCNFIATIRTDRRYCSEACRRSKTDKGRFQYSCFQCGIWFYAKGDRVFCSDECRILYESCPIIDGICKGCGKKVPPLISKGISNGKRRYSRSIREFCSHECMMKSDAYKEKLRGSNHHNWQGGKSFMGGRGPGWKQKTEKIRKRDKYTCQDCGKKESDEETAFPVHHIIPYWNFSNWRTANRDSNLITLCTGCHVKAEYKVQEKQLALL